MKWDPEHKKRVQETLLHPRVRKVYAKLGYPNPEAEVFESTKKGE